jgi:predicted CXXCH cytochrome family protein
MKSPYKLILVLLIILSGRIAWADLNGSAHDFSSKAWSGGQICTICHTPHNSQTAVVPLWNHGATTASFTLYSSPTFKASTTQPTGASRACLSCHDGTVALDTFGGKTGTTLLAGRTLLGNDLSNDHPISFIYDSALAVSVAGLRDPSAAPSGLGGTIRDNLLFNDRLECASCHDVHNSHNQANLLVKNNSGSALCLTCHVK